LKLEISLKTGPRLRILENILLRRVAYMDGGSSRWMENIREMEA
jgi:hypothetical protein